MIGKIMKTVKSSNKKRGRNITIGGVVGFLLSCPLVMGEGLEITQKAGDEILFNGEIYDKTKHPFKENTFENNIYTNNTEIIKNGQLGLAIEIADDFQLEIYNNNLISADNSADAYGIYNSRSKIKKIENNGTISVKGAKSSVGMANFSGEIESIENNGTISVKATADSFGIYNSGNIGEILNSGIISGESKKDVSNGFGVRNYSGTINNIENKGVIYGNTGNTASGIRNEGKGIIGTINNSGKIIGALANYSRAIYNISGTIKSIENIGIISGEGSKLGAGIAMGSMNAIRGSIKNTADTDNETKNISNTGIIYGKGKSGFGIFINGTTIRTIENSGLIAGVGDSGEAYGIQNNFGFTEIDNIKNTGKIIGISTNGKSKGLSDNNGVSSITNPIDNLGMIIGKGGASGTGFYSESIDGDNINNFGVIYGNTYALEASNLEEIKGNNYGLLVGGLDNVTIENAGSGDTNIKNYGIVFTEAGSSYTISHRYTGGEEVTVDMFSKKRDMKVKNASTSASGSESILGNTYENYILNGITDTLKVSGTGNKIKGSVVNAYTSAIKFDTTENNSLTISGSIINGGLADDGIAIKGDSKNDEVILESGEVEFKGGIREKINTVVNGNIDLGDGDNKLTLSGGVVVNGKISSGSGINDILILGKQSFVRNTEQEEINIFNNIKGFEKTSIYGNVTLSDKTYIFKNDLSVNEEKLIAELGDITLENGSNLILKIDDTQKEGDKITGHALHGNTGSISSNGGKLLLDVGKLSDGSIVNFGKTELTDSMKGNEINYSSDITLDSLSLLHNIEKISSEDIKVTIKGNLPEKSYPDNMSYYHLNRIYQGILSTDQVKYFNILSKENLSIFLDYLNNIYAGNPYSYSSELSRKSAGMFRDIVTENQFKANTGKWMIYGGLTHVDGGTKDTYYGKGDYTYDVGSSDIDADTKITGAYMLGEYGVSDTLTSGVVIGGNKLKSDLSNGSKVDGSALYLGAYAKKYLGNLKVTAGAGFQYGDYDTDRLAVNKVASSIAEPVMKYSDNYNDVVYDIYLNGRYSNLIGDNLFLEPYTTLSYTYIDQDGADEGSKVLAVETDSKSFDYTVGKVGVDLKKVIPHEKGKSTLSAGVSYTKILDGADEEHITGRFKGGSDFDILVAHKNEHSIGLNAKYALELENGVLFDVKGTYSVERDSHNNSGKNKTKGEWIVGAEIGYKF
ncbi:autotransporter outer membrane beta-barrel domain-containing protein [Fusobacterium ulcerans]|uniref:autotransporter outer membrane beta-barrel domain-containing protein n=2 Tax=Fusobacterium ulcerans TaxID=861 RepID=UPI0026DAB7C7|nr:autotransporter outer membrane beta-barrel domain-containing protein [Fusobacterium ulcerans]